MMRLSSSSGTLTITVRVPQMFEFFLLGLIDIIEFFAALAIFSNSRVEDKIRCKVILIKQLSSLWVLRFQWEQLPWGSRAAVPFSKLYPGCEQNFQFPKWGGKGGDLQIHVQVHLVIIPRRNEGDSEWDAKVGDYRYGVQRVLHVSWVIKLE